MRGRIRKIKGATNFALVGNVASAISSGVVANPVFTSATAITTDMVMLMSNLGGR